MVPDAFLQNHLSQLLSDFSLFYRLVYSESRVRPPQMDSVNFCGVPLSAISFLDTSKLFYLHLTTEQNNLLLLYFIMNLIMSCFNYQRRLSVLGLLYKLVAVTAYPSSLSVFISSPIIPMYTIFLLTIRRSIYCAALIHFPC